MDNAPTARTLTDHLQTGGITDRRPPGTGGGETVETLRTRYEAADALCKALVRRVGKCGCCEVIGGGRGTPVGACILCRNDDAEYQRACDLRRKAKEALEARLFERVRELGAEVAL